MLLALHAGLDGIMGVAAPNTSQAAEQRMREKVAAAVYDDYLAEISKHHSIEVMDREVVRFVENIPRGGTVIDVGGCWGWHWRNLHVQRPDLNVVIVDFVRDNLLHARRLLRERIGQNVWLMHGDATKLDLPAGVFDGYWSVQALQHVPDVDVAIQEAARVLKPGGLFANYSLNDGLMIRLVYRLLRREYIVNGQASGRYYLRRADRAQRETVARTFGTQVAERFTELLFKPELRLSSPGRKGSPLGRLDARLSGRSPLAALIARQRSYHARKP